MHVRQTVLVRNWKATKYQCVVYQQIEQKKKNGFCQLSNKSQLKSQRGSVGSASWPLDPSMEVVNCKINLKTTSLL